MSRAGESLDSLPAASTADTVYEYGVPAESPVCVKLVPVVLPAAYPLRQMLYLTTPTLSVEAVHVSVTELWLPSHCRFEGAVGLVLSVPPGGGAAAAAVVTCRDADSADRLPAASTADTVYVYVVLAERPLSLKLVPDTVPTVVPLRRTR